MPKLNVQWSDVKTFATDRNLLGTMQYVVANNQYYIWSVDGPMELSCQIPMDGSDSTDQTDFETNYLAGCNGSLGIRKNPSGAQVVDTSDNLGFAGAQSMTVNTHDFSDRTTWYQRSAQVTSETLTDSGDGLTFNSANANWVNMDSERLTYDYNLVPERDGTYTDLSTRRPVVVVNGTQINDTTVSTTPGYTVNYAAGTITFGASQSGNTVVVTYWHNNGVSRCSEWILNPPSGMFYTVGYIEAQFSNLLVFTTSMHIEIWAGADVATYGDFDFTLYTAGYGQNRSIYRGPLDFMNVCTNRDSQVISPFGGLSDSLLIFPFDYTIDTVIRSDEGVVIMFCLNGDTPYTGAELATITFYSQLVPLTSLL